MFIKRFLYFFAVIIGISACTPKVDWNSEYGQVPVTAPSQMQSGFYYPQYDVYGKPESMYTHAPATTERNITVLLPLSGVNSSVGRGIKTSIEMAFLQQSYKNISINFIDLTGNMVEKQNIILTALATQPDIIIGPVFAEDARMLRDLKPDNLPVLSFSSDISAFGNGVMTMALMPTQSIEAIVREMANDKTKKFVVLAPKTVSGGLMAGAAVQAANLYDLPISGLFYYQEGNTDSIKSTVQKVSMNTARTAANTRAREILSDILIKEKLTDAQKLSLKNQLEKISKSDVLGSVPFDAILFLGAPNDSKTVASFLRYYDVTARDASFYGTVLWDTPELTSDFTMTGAKFAVLPAMSPDFVKLYEQLAGTAPSRLNTFGFDATNVVVGAMFSDRPVAAYLLDPSGYKGLDGLFRLRPNGISERALQIVELTGSGTPRLVRPAATDFLTPLYNVHQRDISVAGEIPMVSNGINPLDHIKIPVHLQPKYKSKTYGTRVAAPAPIAPPAEVIIMPEDDRDEIITSPDYQPVERESIGRKLIDSVEVSG